jgi:glutathione S-transferase
MADLTLYHMPPSRSMIVRWMLEEVGQPYDVALVKSGETRKPAYLAVNPFGKVPALKHGDVVTTEVAAICCYLADAFPDARLAIPVGDKRRGPYLKWLFFGPSCFEPAMLERTMGLKEVPRGQVGWPPIDSVLDEIGKAVTPGPFLMGQQFTAADVVIGSGLGWAMMIKAIPERPDLVAYVGRVNARPAAQRARAKDQELMKAA